MPAERSTTFATWAARRSWRTRSARVTTSRGAARRLIRGGGVYLNGERVADMGVAVGQSDPIDDRYVLVRIGKKRHLVVEVG